MDSMVNFLIGAFGNLGGTIGSGPVFFLRLPQGVPENGHFHGVKDREGAKKDQV